MFDLTSIVSAITGAFILGVTFYAGRLTSRVDRLEEWRAEVRDEFKALHGHLERLAATMMAGPNMGEHNGIDR